MSKRLSRKQFEQELAQYHDALRRIVETTVGGFAAGPDAKRQRLDRQQQSLHFFAYTYLPHYVDRNVAPSRFQQWAYDHLPEILSAPYGVWQAIAAPRGEAKTTLAVQILALWCICNGLKRFIPILSDTYDQAATILEAIKVELEANPRLAMDFPDATGEGRVWQAGVILSANEVKLQAFGALKKVRGIRHGPYRPDLVLCDDLENDDNVRSKAQRDKRESWLKKAVLNLGPPDGSMDVIYVGTVLHYDSVLSRTMKAPRWRARAQMFRSIIRWPDRMDLWDAWEEVLLNDGEDAARQYYMARAAEMEAGAEVSWPAMRPLYHLMALRAEDHAAFDSEHQNNPMAGAACPFDGCIKFWVQRCRRWVFFGAHDPSMGKHRGSGDPAATLVGGFDREHGVLDVVEAIVARRIPDKQIEDIIGLHTEYGTLVFGVEDNAFQEFFRGELVKRSARTGRPVPARGITAAADKDLRIESLQPHVANGLIRLHRNQRTLIEQLQYWPEADHDDGPDALHMLWMLAVTGAGGIPRIRTGRARKAMRGARLQVPA